MVPFEMNLATVVVGLAIAGCAVLAVRRLARRGTCGCGEGCDAREGGCAGCSGCGAADRMVADLRAQAGEARREP